MPSKYAFVVLAVFVLLAGCSGGSFLGEDVVTEKKPEEPKLVDAVLSGGGCVDSPENAVEVATRSDGGERSLVVAGNVSVPDASYTLGQPKLVETEFGNYSLRVSSHRATKKPKANCTALANYTATIDVPEGGPNNRFTFTVVHDGEVVHRENVTNR